MKNIKNIFYSGLLALCTMSLAACSDEDTYDFPGDPYNRVYLLDNSSSYKIVQTPISAVSNLKFETNLKCTQKASGNIIVTVEIDNSMIAAYNEQNGTNYEEIPAAALVIENATLHIPMGAMATADTLRIAMSENYDLSTLRSENGYLIPLRITKVEGENSRPSSNAFFSYLIVTVTENNVNNDAVIGDITGTLVTDQTGWSATTNATVSPSYKPLTYLFTTDVTSYCYLYNTSTDGLILDVNMGKSYTFDGIAMYRSSRTSSFANGMTIYISNDGTAWQKVGTVTRSSTFCAFYTPVTSQYIRVVKPKATSGNTTLYVSIFNVYAK